MKQIKKFLLIFDVAFFLALKNIFYKKKMLIMITIIIALGFLSTIFSTSIINGLKTEIENKAISVITGNVLLEPKDKKDFIYDVNNLEKKILSIPEVIAISPHINRGVTLIDNNGNKISMQLRIIDPNKESIVSSIDDNIITGKYLSEKSMSEIFIGADLTKKYRSQEALPAIDIDSGEKITIFFDNGVKDKVKVKGIYSLNFAATDVYIYITKEYAKKVFNLSDKDLNVASEILIKTSSKSNENKVRDKILQLGFNGKIWVWEERLGVLSQYTRSLLIISKFTAIISIIIAFATIYIMIYINVLNKKTQIGIMKAIGITKETILFSYIIQSFIYGILGCILGYLLTKFVLFYYTINPIIMPVGPIYPIIDSKDYIFSFIILLVSSVIAGYIPSRGVVKEEILDAIYKG